MANSNLFMKSGFPRAPLQNGLGRYIGQLQRITLKFCKNNGSSRGIREYLENELVNFAKTNPGVVVYVKPRRHKTPVMVAEYLNGDRQWVNCHNYTAQEVHKWIDLLKRQNGNSSELRLRKMWHTEQPSIQGPWTPFTNKEPAKNVAQFPESTFSTPLVVPQSATEKLIEIFKQQKIAESQLLAKRAE